MALTNHDLTYVTQEMWDRAQEALKAALPMIEAHTPPLSTAGTMVSLRAQVRAAIVGAGVEPQAGDAENAKLRQIIADVMFREMHGLTPVLRTGDVEWASITPKSGVEPGADSEEEPAYPFELAFNIARNWRAGKMISGDEDGVRNALLAEIERLLVVSAPAAEYPAYEPCECGCHKTGPLCHECCGGPPVNRG